MAKSPNSGSKSGDPLAKRISFRIRYQLTEAQFIRVHRAHLASAFFSARTFALLAFALGISALQAQIFGGADWALRVFAGLGLALLIGLGFTMFYLPIRLFRRDAKLASSTLIESTPNGFRLSRDGESAEEIPAATIAKVSQRQGFLILERTGKLPLAVPSDAFDSADALVAFREHLIRGVWDSPDIDNHSQ